MLILLFLALPIGVSGEGAPPGLTGGPLESSNAGYSGQSR